MRPPFSLSIEQLKKSYANRIVLDIDRIDVKSGHTYALVGPNGSGKSTLLRILAGAIDANDGGVVVHGDIRAEELRVGFMPQKSYAFGLSVFRNVALALEGCGLSRGEVSERVASALDAVGISDFADARGSSLSGGEAQRMALARILVRDLDVVLLDEPTASMDISATLLVEEALAKYREKTGCLLLVATHAPSQARRIANSILMLSEGRVVECGEVQDVLVQPASAQGREFLSYWSV